MVAEYILMGLLVCGHYITEVVLILMLDELAMFRSKCIGEGSYSLIVRCAIYIIALSNFVVLLANIGYMANLFIMSYNFEQSDNQLGGSLFVWLASQILLMVESPIMLVAADGKVTNKPKMLDLLRDNFIVSGVLYVCMIICSLFMY